MTHLWTGDSRRGLSVSPSGPCTIFGAQIVTSAATRVLTALGRRGTPSCIFCGSSDHRRGVECNQPALYDHHVRVLSGTVRAPSFQRKTPSQRRLALNGQHWRDAYTRSRRHGGDDASAQDPGPTDSDFGSARLLATERRPSLKASFCCWG